MRKRRGSQYDPESTPELAEQYARDGYLNKEIALKLGVRADTFSRWLKQYPQLSQALKRGQADANAELVRGMIRTALGYDIKETETTAILDRDQKPKSYKKTVKKRHIPPNATMQIFLAKNRMPDEFRDVNKHEITGANGSPVALTADYYNLSALSEDELKQLRGILVKASVKDITDDSGDRCPSGENP